MTALPRVPLPSPAAQFGVLDFAVESTVPGVPAGPRSGCLVRRTSSPNGTIEEVVTVADGDGLPEGWGDDATLGLYRVRDGVTEVLRTDTLVLWELFRLVALAPSGRMWPGMCPTCRVRAVLPLPAPDAEREAAKDGTTHVCHPLLGGCNHGFEVLPSGLA